MDRMPNSKVNLDRAISRYTNRDTLKATELGVAMANAIVAQLIGDGVVKGGTSLKFRYGDASTRYTTDLELTGAICRKLFKYRRKQPWPSLIEKGEHWDDVYDRQKRDLPVLPTADEAIKWTNALIARLSSLGTASVED